MAQFQILYSPAETEWRQITTEFCMAPVSDQQYVWPSFEEADAVRKRLSRRFPEARLRIAIEGIGAGDIDWRTREKLRFADGTYTETPWHDEPWYQAVHGEHFCHLSTDQAGKIAFTENCGKGQLDRQLVMSPGRYLHRYFPQILDNNAIESWCARLSVLLAEHALKITQDADEIEEVYVGGPASCMARAADDFESCCHPVRVYAGPDTALAYIGARDDARARSVIWPDRKIYTTIYGDVSRLKLLLEAAGFCEGGLNGARIQRIEDGEGFVVPYIDGGDDLGDNGEFLVIGQGSICSESTNGLGRVPWYCPRCENDATAYDEVWFADGSCEEWCHGCFHNCTTFCEHNELHYSDSEDFIVVCSTDAFHDILEQSAEAFGAVFLGDRSEWWTAPNCRKCDGSGEMFHINDLTEYFGEWLSTDYVPEPFDDNAADIPNAHVIAQRRSQAGLSEIASDAQRLNFQGEETDRDTSSRGCPGADPAVLAPLAGAMWTSEPPAASPPPLSGNLCEVTPPAQHIAASSSPAGA
jgi:hypothetical protein